MGWKAGIGDSRAPRPSTRDRIMLARALRDIERQLMQAEELADKNLATSREMLAACK